MVMEIKAFYLLERQALLMILFFLISKLQDPNCSQSLKDFVMNKVVKKKLTENLTKSLVRV